MSRPLNDDGTVPRRRRMQLVLRITGDDTVEVSRYIQPLWTRESSKRMLPVELIIAAQGFDADPREEMIGIVADELCKVATPHMLSEMLRELLGKVKA